MLETEYIKSLQCNYERLRLEEKPEERRYQYCIVCRGGITGLLPVSLRYINGDAFLYYDITSRQSLAQMYRKKTLGRQWLMDFVWNLRKIRQEMNRFLLEEHNLIWYPEQIYQDLGEHVFSFLYVPYLEGENGFMQLLEFMVERADYEDEALIAVIYRMYEQYEQHGEVYLQEQIYEDIRELDQTAPEHSQALKQAKEPAMIRRDTLHLEKRSPKPAPDEDWEYEEEETEEEEEDSAREDAASGESREKKGLLAFLDSSRRKNRETREKYRELQQKMLDGASVAEESFYEPEEGEEEEELEEVRTVYMETVAERKDTMRRLYGESGRVLWTLRDEEVVLGKRSGGADVILDDPSVSRMHARIESEGGFYYIEDLNSTNGTFHNGTRLSPYERRKLQPEDELRLGGAVLSFR